MASFLVSFGIAIWRGIILKSWRRSLSLKNWDHIPILSALLQSYSMSWYYIDLFLERSRQIEWIG